MILHQKVVQLKSERRSTNSTLHVSLPHKEFVGGAYYDKCAVGKMNEKCKDEKLKKAVIDWTLKTMKEISEKKKLNLDI